MPTASDLVDRDFQRSEPDQLWVTDITEHPTREGKVYCAVVLDTFSRRVVGWSIDAQPTAALATNALGMAIDNRQPVQGETIIHSDHGTQYTSWAFTQRAVDSGLVPSMGSIGDCFDNAVIESFWSRMQVELLDTRRVRDSTSRNNSSMNPESCLRETQGTPEPAHYPGRFSQPSGGRSRSLRSRGGIGVARQHRGSRRLAPALVDACGPPSTCGQASSGSRAYERALDCPMNDSDRRFLEVRLAELV